ncbi:hypothetical protein ES703_114448 [subsurface metagenome]
MLSIASDVLATLPVQDIAHLRLVEHDRKAGTFVVQESILGSFLFVV